MSQYGEHQLILDHFGSRTGRFLDVGAFDGVTFSNTYPLYRAGWKGVMVEPAPTAFSRLEMTYPENTGVELVNAAICRESGLRLFHSCQGDFPSTFRGDRKEHFSRHPYRPITVNATTWEALLDMFPGPYDFLNIDVEGLNLEVLMDCPIIDQIEMVCIEADPEGQIPIMESLLGDTHPNVRRIGGNILAWK